MASQPPMMGAFFIGENRTIGFLFKWVGKIICISAEFSPDIKKEVDQRVKTILTMTELTHPQCRGADISPSIMGTILNPYICRLCQSLHNLLIEIVENLPPESPAREIIRNPNLNLEDPENKNPSFF